MKGLQFFISIFTIVCFSGFCSVLNAQDVFEVGDRNWKTSPALSTVIADEISRTNVVLAVPDLHADDRLLTTAYQKMLTLLQTDIQGNVPVGDAVLHSFKQVVSASNTDAALKGLVPSQFAEMMPVLLETLSETPQMVPQTGL